MGVREREAKVLQNRGTVMQSPRLPVKMAAQADMACLFIQTQQNYN